MKRVIFFLFISIAFSSCDYIGPVLIINKSPGPVRIVYQSNDYMPQDSMYSNNTFYGKPHLLRGTNLDSLSAKVRQDTEPALAKRYISVTNRVVTITIPPSMSASFTDHASFRSFDEQMRKYIISITDSAGNAIELKSDNFTLTKQYILWCEIK